MIGNSWLKGYLELRDGAGKVLASSEGYHHWDPLIDIALPVDGDYTFAFRDLMYRAPRRPSIAWPSARCPARRLSFPSAVVAGPA